MPDNEPQNSEHWLSITDFSPGCYSQGGVVVGNTSDRMLAAPPGAADALNTWSCYALTNKSLAALPGITQTYAWPDTTNPSGYNHAGGGVTYVVGCLLHDELADNTTECVLIGEFDDGSNHYWQAYSFIPDTPAHTSLVATVNVHASGIFGSPYPQFTRVANAYVVSTVSVGATTTITVLNATQPFTVGTAFYLTQLPSGVVGLSLNTAYTPTSVATVSLGVSYSATFTTTPATSGSYTGSPSPGGVTILTIPYGPVCVFPSGGPAQAAQATAAAGQLYMYPNPANRSSYGVFNMMANPGQSVSGQTIVHQSRILCLAGVNYVYPAGSGFNTNENVQFTDPPLSASMGNQQTVLAAEEPYGYGGAGSISAGELFLVKKRGGGLIVTGDIFAPSVTILPGVTSTGNFYGQGASTPLGFIYASEDNGMWAWNGSNTSQKVSENLDNAFFLPPEFSGGMNSNNYAYFVAEYGNRIYTSNNWMLDLQNNAWWTYYPRKAQGGQDLYYVQPVNGNYIYAAQLSFVGNTSLNFMYRFDPATAAQSYQYQTLPLRLADPDHRADIREIVVKASCQTAGCTITLSVLDQETVVWGPIANSNTVTDGPQMLRFNAAAIGVTSPAIRLVATGAGSGDMPVIESIDIRYGTRAHQAVGD